MASNQNRLAEEKARELKHLNRSMWAMKVDNPFTKSRNDNRRDEGMFHPRPSPRNPSRGYSTNDFPLKAIMDNHRKERERRDQTRAAAWQSQNRQEETSRGLRAGLGSGSSGTKNNLAERSKYQYEVCATVQLPRAARHTDDIHGRLIARTKPWKMKLIVISTPCMVLLRA